MPVELNVRSELSRIIGELQQIHGAAQKVGDGLDDAGKKIGDSLNGKAKETETYLARLQSFGGRVADQLVRDFKALASVNALAGSLKFSETFRGSIKETIALSDTVRKLSGTLGIAGKDMAKFQNDATRSLSKVGLSSEALSNSLSGLAETPVRGQGNFIAYAERAGELASVSRQRGSEGDIARGLSRVVTARGGNPNDQAQMRAVSDDVLRIRQATGKSATEILGAMEQLFSGANKAFRSRLQGGGAVSLAAAALLGGQGSTSFLEGYLKTNKFQQFSPNSQGLGGIVGANGALNLTQMEAVLRDARGRGLGDEQAGLTTMGLSNEEAQGFIRLTEALRENQAVVESARTKQVDLRKTYQDSLEMGEAFNRVLSRTKGIFQFSGAGHGLTSLLTGAGNSDAGAIATTVGSGILAALLTGGGIRGIAKAAGIEAATGREVTPVFVTNFPAGFGGAGGLLGQAASGLGIAGALGAVGIGAAAVGTGALIAANESKLAAQATEPLERARAKQDSDNAILKEISGHLQQIKFTNGANGRVRVELNKRELREASPQNRGASFGP